MDKDICVDIPCRKEQISSLTELIGQLDEPLPPAVFVYGQTATGKTFVVSEVLEALKYNHAFVNCVECYIPQLLFEPILSKLHNYVPTVNNNYVPYINCDNMMDFVNHLKNSETVAEDEPCIIVLDKCERLRDMDANLLPAFLRLQELTGLPNVCVILLSDIVFEKFRIKEGFMEPLQIYFPPYSRDELVEILLLDHSEGSKWPKDFYCSYVKLFLGIFHRACRDLNELRYMAQLNFSKFCEPVLKGEAEIDDINKLWRHVTPHLKTSLTQLYLRTSSFDEESSSRTSQLSSSATYALSFELPYYTKFFLIAAYLASYNPVKADRRLYVKNHGKQKKSKNQQRQKKQDHLLGPKPFAVVRLLAIFYAIVKEDVNLTAVLLSQMSALVKLQLLTVVGDDRIDMPRYKCAVDFEFINTIARNVKFNIRNYLYEYM